MSQRLPPMNSLRAFEAAARHGSFVKAAAELHVTAAAISHQVRELEQTLNLKLFLRRPRGVILSETGNRYYKDVAEVFRLLGQATLSLQNVDIAGPLELSAPHAFCQFWLAPRLQKLRAAMPQLRLTVKADNHICDMRTDKAQVAVRFGMGQYPGLHSVFLMSDAAAPLVSTSKLEYAAVDRKTLLQTELLLAEHNLNPDEPWMGWSPWLREARVNRAKHNTLSVSDSALALSACLAGNGLCIGRLSLVFEAIKRQQLSILMPWRITDYGYYLLCSNVNINNPRIQAFSQWLQEEIREFTSSTKVLCDITHNNN